MFRTLHWRFSNRTATLQFRTVRKDGLGPFLEKYCTFSLRLVLKIYKCLLGSKCFSRFDQRPGKTAAPRQIVDFFPELQKGSGERSCTTSCSMIQPFLGSCKIKTALCLTFLWGYLTFYPCVRDPGACLISSFNTPTHNLHFVTRHVNRGAPVWFVESLFLVELTCEVQLKQYIPSSRSSLEPNKLREKLTEPTLDRRSCHPDWERRRKKRSDCDITGSFEEGDWIYQTVQKGITNLSDLQVLPTRAEIWAIYIYIIWGLASAHFARTQRGVRMKSHEKVAAMGARNRPLSSPQPEHVTTGWKQDGKKTASCHHRAWLLMRS